VIFREGKEWIDLRTQSSQEHNGEINQTIMLFYAGIEALEAMVIKFKLTENQAQEAFVDRVEQRP
jgi:hypothetical protein